MISDMLLFRVAIVLWFFYIVGAFTIKIGSTWYLFYMAFVPKYREKWKDRRKKLKGKLKEKYREHMIVFRGGFYLLTLGEILFFLMVQQELNLPSVKSLTVIAVTVVLIDNLVLSNNRITKAGSFEIQTVESVSDYAHHINESHRQYTNRANKLNELIYKAPSRVKDFDSNEKTHAGLKRFLEDYTEQFLIKTPFVHELDIEESEGVPMAEQMSTVLDTTRNQLTLDYKEAVENTGRTASEESLEEIEGNMILMLNDGEAIYLNKDDSMKVLIVPVHLEDTSLIVVLHSEDTLYEMDGIYVSNLTNVYYQNKART